MFYDNNNTTKILGLKDVFIEDIKASETTTYISIKLIKKEQVCPGCGARTNKVHDYRKQYIKDLDSYGKETILILRKRRYCCKECKKRFAEANTFLPKYYRRTQRSILNAINGLRETVSGKHIAKENHMSCTTLWRYFSFISYKCPRLPDVISIDEFKGNANGEKYQTIVTSPKKNIILDVLPNRYEDNLIEYFRKFPDKNNVRYFVIDMNEHFKRVGQYCFKNAKIIADRYHVIRQVFWAMENVRKRVQNNLSDNFRKYFKRSKKILYKDISQLTEDEMNKLTIMFGIAPELAQAYNLKNKFVNVMNSKSSTEGKKALSNWIFLADTTGPKEFKNCTTAYTNWFNEILNSLDVPFTNGYTEGCNNKTKVIKRNGYGIRNFNRLRMRILFAN